MISSCRGHEDNWRCRGELRVDRESHERICIRPNLDQVGACEGNNDGFHASLPVPFFRLDPGCVARRAMRLSPLLFMRSWRPGSVRGGLPAHSDMPLEPGKAPPEGGAFLARSDAAHPSWPSANHSPSARDCSSPRRESGTSTSRWSSAMRRSPAASAASRATLPALCPYRTTQRIEGQRGVIGGD